MCLPTLLLLVFVLFYLVTLGRANTLCNSKDSQRSKSAKGKLCRDLVKKKRDGGDQETWAHKCFPDVSRAKLEESIMIWCLLVQWKEYKYGNRRSSWNSDFLASNDSSFYTDNGFHNNCLVLRSLFENHTVEYVFMFHSAKWYLN